MHELQCPSHSPIIFHNVAAIWFENFRAYDPTVGPCASVGVKFESILVLKFDSVPDIDFEIKSDTDSDTKKWTNAL